MVESSPLPPGTVRLQPDLVAEFAGAVFRATGLSAGDASLAADVLVSADLRGIRSHGVARLPYFVVRLERGVINPTPTLRFERLSATTGRVDGDNGMGMSVSQRAMSEAIAMATEHGSGFVTATASNHFGYAGYWAVQAMTHGCIGIAMSSSGRRTAPTFSTEAMLGTNPLAVAIPGGETDFVLDMATSAVAVGKVETALREDRPLAPGWVSELGSPPGLDTRGVLTYDAPLLPLGGEGDVTGGHKGYGLGLLVELLCGALAGSALDTRVRGSDGSAPAAMGHFFGAIRIDGFRHPDRVAEDMAATFATLRGAEKAPGHDRVFIHGEPETIAAETNGRLGIPITPALLDQMRGLDTRLELGYDL